MGRLVYFLCLTHCVYLIFAFTSPNAKDSIQHHLSKDIPATPFPSLDEASLDEINHLLADGTLSSVDLVNTYIKRTNEVNGYLRTVSEINPDAVLIAKARDEERAAGLLRGPLHGIPIYLKDNIATTDALNTTAGSYALVGARPKHEAFVVQKLRNAGAIILGKVTMGEWAQFRSSFESNSHGWSPLGGQTLGAYYPQQDPHGSSSGSAVAVSVGLAAGSLGTETSGSIVNPAERNNVVGIKPTLGLTSRNMVIPISMRQDVVGPMAQTVKDAAIMLTAISGKDHNDNWTHAQPFLEVPDYAQACKLSALRGARLGVPRNGIDPFLSSATQPIMTAFEAALTLVQGAGAYVNEGADFPTFDQNIFRENTKIVLGTDFESGLKAYLGSLATNPQNMHDLQDLAAFTKHHPLEEVHYRDTVAWDNQIRRNLTSDCARSRAAYQGNIDAGEITGVVGALDRYNLDALIMPTFTSFYLPAIAGLPVITVPLGFYPADTTVAWNPKGTLINKAPGIPFGLAFIGRKWSEETLISLAYAFEQRSMARKQRKPLVRPISGLDSKVVAEPTHLQPDGPNRSPPARKIARESEQSLLRKLMGRVSRSHSWTIPVFQVT